MRARTRKTFPVEVLLAGCSEERERLPYLGESRFFLMGSNMVLISSATPDRVEQLLLASEVILSCRVEQVSPGV
jgi:hypothetical protein